MDKEFQNALLLLLQLVGGGFCTVLWFNYRDLKSQVARNTKELADYKVHIAEDYVTKDALSKTFDALTKAIDALGTKIEYRLERIDNKLDHKQDKP